MDIRVQKTKRSIFNAFLQLRAARPLEKISVRELCETAQINKSTFYKYYTDLYDLSDQMESQVIDQIVANLAHPEAIVADPRTFTRELTLACTSQSVMIDVLFSGNRREKLVVKLRNAIKNLLFQTHPEYRGSDAINIYLTYAVFGGYYAMAECKEYDRQRVCAVLGEILETSSRLLLEKW